MPVVVKAVAMDAAVTEAAAERGVVGLEKTVGADVGGVDAEETLVAEKNDAPFAAQGLESLPFRVRVGGVGSQPASVAFG